MAATHPEVLWAQRSSASNPEKNVIYLTVNLPDIDPTTLQCDLQPNSLSFKAKAANLREYAFNLEFLEEILPEDSRQSLTTRHLTLVLRKKENKAEFWPRLTKEKTKLAFVKTDFSKWVDEDEQDSGVQALDDDVGDFGGMGGGGMDFGNMGGMGGMGGMDMEKLMSSMKAGSGVDPVDDDADEDKEDNEDNGPPPLE